MRGKSRAGIGSYAVYASVCFLLMWSCGDGGRGVSGPAVGGGKTAAGGLSPEVFSTERTSPNEKATTVSFSELSYDFGTVEEGAIVTKVFSFTNTGDKPLVIANASSTCGCTVPEWPKGEVFPRQKKGITVRFDTQGKRGTQHKKIWITANTEPAITTLLLKGEVVPKNSLNL